MIALFNFIPKYCPNCGNKLFSLISNVTKHDDYNHYAAHYCLRCSVTYQKAIKAHMLNAATLSGGDLENYASE